MVYIVAGAFTIFFSIVYWMEWCLFLDVRKASRSTTRKTKRE